MPINVQFEYQIIPAFVTCLQCSYPDTISWAFSRGGRSEIYFALFFVAGMGLQYSLKIQDFSTFREQQLHAMFSDISRTPVMSCSVLVSYSWVLLRFCL
jgi:hypothetical protein